MKRLLLAAVLLGLAACGNSASGSNASSLQAVNKGNGVGTALSDSNGKTLYYFTPENGGGIQCTGGCAVNWPPLTVSGNTTPSLPSGFSGTLGTISRPDGSTQLTYNGHPLYDYSGDSSSSDANGQGLSGNWYAVTASLTAGGSGNNSNSNSSPSATMNSGSSGGGGGGGGGGYNYN